MFAKPLRFIQKKTKSRGEFADTLRQSGFLCNLGGPRLARRGIQHKRVVVRRLWSYDLWILLGVYPTLLGEKIFTLVVCTNTEMGSGVYNNFCSKFHRNIPLGKL